MITPLYAGFLSFLLIGLSVNIIKGRRLYGAAIGDANNIDMKRRIRAQANFLEYAPIFLILLSFSENNSLPAWAIHSLGLVFFLGRLMHAYSLLYAEKYEGEKLKAKPIWRMLGMMCTFATLGILSVIMFVQGVVL